MDELTSSVSPFWMNVRGGVTVTKKEEPVCDRTPIKKKRQKHIMVDLEELKFM